MIFNIKFSIIITSKFLLYFYICLDKQKQIIMSINKVTIVGIKGFKGSGKDTVASMISYILHDGIMKANYDTWLLYHKNDFVENGGKKLLVKKVSMDAGSVKDIVFQLKKEVENAVIIIISDADGKPMITVGVSQDLEAQYHAGNIVKDLAKEIQGGGGGNPGFATAGGKNLEGIENAYQKALAL